MKDGTGQKLSGGAPFFNMCLCLQSRERVPSSQILLETPCTCRYKRPCTKTFFLANTNNKAQICLAIKIYSV